MPALRGGGKTHTHTTTDGDGKRVRWRQTTAVTQKWSEQGFFYFEALLTRRVPYPKLRLEGTAKSKPCKRRRWQMTCTHSHRRRQRRHTHRNFESFKLFHIRIISYSNLGFYNLYQLLALAIYEGRLLRNNTKRNKKQKHKNKNKGAQKQVWSGSLGFGWY